MQILHLLLPMLAGDIAWNKFHRPRTVKRDHGDNILKLRRFQFFQIPLHAGRFQLKHARRIRVPKKLKGFFVVQRKLRNINGNPVNIFYKANRFFNNRKVF